MKLNIYIHIGLKVIQKNFCKARLRMRRVMSILFITHLTRSLMGNQHSYPQTVKKTTVQIKTKKEKI